MHKITLRIDYERIKLSIAIIFKGNSEGYMV